MILRALGIAALAGITLSAVVVKTASTSVATTNLGAQSEAVTANELKPSECTVTVTSITVGSGIFSPNGSNQLVLASSGNDTIVESGSNDCIVGGAGVDSVTALGSNDQCIVSTSTLLVTGCTVVARRP